MVGTGVGRAAAVAAPVIVLILSGLFALSFVVSALLGLPPSLDLPVVVRVLGGAIVVVGLAFAGWVFRYRKPADVIVSTYVTFTKLAKRAPMSEMSGRTEQLVINGPQKYVRSPLYFGVIVMVFGWALVGGYTFVLVATVVLLIWFRFVLVPFEEKELRALFGEQYARYADEVPMLIPFTKRNPRRVSARSRATNPGHSMILNE